MTPPLPDTVYALLSEILGMSARYSTETFLEAEEYVRATYNGIDRERVLAVITELRRLAERATARPSTRDSVERRENSTPTPFAREIEAVLRDPSFLPSKVDVAQFASRHHLDVRADPKDSRTRTVERALATFNRLPEKRQKAIYQSVRRTYLRGRQASLGEWSDIIEKPSSEG